MNYKMIFYMLGQLLKIVAFFLLFPLIISLCYKENTWYAFLIPLVILFIIGFILSYKKPENKIIYAKEGFVITGISWILISLFGSLPFIISRDITNFADAFFETVSGFTTTGATILNDIEALGKGMLFWRSLTHWIGGMGVLVFMIAIIPTSDARSINLMKAESTGPQVGKLVYKVKTTARILYSIYIVLTLIEIILLLCGGMPLYDSLVHSFGTAGTGGYSMYQDSIGYYALHGYNNAVYFEVVITIFMFIFGINFNIFFLILIGNLKNAFKNKELIGYFSIVAIAIIVVTLNLYFNVKDAYNTIGESLRYSSFHVVSVVTTTGFCTADYNTWPALSQCIIVFLMFVGACAGSTGGGLKVSRVIILIKSFFREVKSLLHPKSVKVITMDKKPLDESVIKGVNVFFITYIIILGIVTFIISIDGQDILTNFTATLSCLSNVGPGLGKVGPVGNFAIFSNFSKIILSITMLAGRLEIFPILLLFYPKTWKNF